VVVDFLDELGSHLFQEFVHAVLLILSVKNIWFSCNVFVVYVFGLYENRSSKVESVYFMPRYI